MVMVPALFRLLGFGGGFGLRHDLTRGHCEGDGPATQQHVSSDHEHSLMNTISLLMNAISECDKPEFSDDALHIYKT
jgi:hypothetical protein